MQSTSASPSVSALAGRRRLAGAVFGAAATFLVLLGATTVADAPRQLSDVPGSLTSIEAFGIAPDAGDETWHREPAIGSFEGSGPLELTPALA